jgi:hypothetical protein
MAWFDLYEISGEQHFLASYRGVIDYSLATHDSFLPGDADPARVMDRLHAYCYFLEGLLPVASEDACAAAIGVGIERVAGYLREIGPTFARSDVYAQLLRVRLFAEKSGVVPLDRASAEFEAGRLAEFQSDGADSLVAGGFWFGRKGEEMMPFINPVSAAFGLQALTMWDAYCTDGPPLDRHSLI